MSDRKAYQREYHQKRRAKEKAARQVSAGFTAEHLALIREIVDQAIAEALRARDTGVCANTVNTPPCAEVAKNYRRPDPEKPADPRCQAANRDGSRCGASTKLVVTALDPSGQPGEFGTCKRHQAEFRPHPGAMEL